MERPTARWAVAGIVLAALVVLALAQRWGGIDPVSLFLDDIWVGLVVREMSAGDFFVYRPPVPIGFVYVLKGVTGALGPGAWQLQTFPLLCGLLLIPSVAWLAFQLSGSLSLALLAGALAALDPSAAELSLRVKQYTCDAFFASLVLNCAVLAVRSGTLRAYRGFVAVSVVAMWLSFSSLFVMCPAFVLVTVAVWLSQRSVAGSDRAFWMSAAVFPVLLGLFCGLVVFQQRHSGIVDYWGNHFLPMEPGAALAFLQSKGVAFLTGPFPGELAWLGALVPIGIAGLLVRRDTRWFGAYAGLFYLQALVLAALRLYPLGGGRIDTYSHALTISLAVLGIWALAPRRATPWLAAASLAGLLWLGVDQRYDYTSFHSQQAAQRLNEAAAPGDGIVVYPHAGYTLGFYGRWPTELIYAPKSSNGFYASADRPDVTLLPEFVDGVYFGKDPTRMEPELSAFLAGSYERVHYLGTHLRGRPHRWILDEIRTHGYAVEERYDEGDSAWYLFRRQVQPSSTAAPGP